jgi:hypothetical protein
MEATDIHRTVRSPQKHQINSFSSPKVSAVKVLSNLKVITKQAKGGRNTQREKKLTFF